MSARLTIGCVPELAGLLRSLTATLPRSFHVVEGVESPSADVQLLDGRTPWARLARDCADSGAEWTIIVDPDEEEPDRILALADFMEEAGPAMTFSEPFTDNPTLPHFLTQLPEAISSCNMQAWTTGSIRKAALVQLRLARALGIRELALLDVCSTPHSNLLTFRGKRNDAAVSLRTLITASAAMSSRHIVRTYAADVMARLTLFDAETARPAEAAIVNEGGEVRLPTIYETAHRSVLRGLSGRAGMTAADLRDFAADVALVQSLNLA
jgi:hypothetical protein